MHGRRPRRIPNKWALGEKEKIKTGAKGGGIMPSIWGPPRGKSLTMKFDHGKETAGQKPGFQKEARAKGMERCYLEKRKKE